MTDHIWLFTWLKKKLKWQFLGLYCKNDWTEVISFCFIPRWQNHWKENPIVCQWLTSENASVQNGMSHMTVLFCLESFYVSRNNTVAWLFFPLSLSLAFWPTALPFYCFAFLLLGLFTTLAFYCTGFLASPATCQNKRAFRRWVWSSRESH